MKSFFIAAIIAIVSTACTVGTHHDTLPRDRDATHEENVRLRKEVARLQQEKGQGRQPMTDKRTVVQAANVSRGAMWVRPKHGVYMGTVGEQPRQMSQGRMIKVRNLVCDDGARGFLCNDRNENGTPDFNTWLTFRIDGAHAHCDSGFVHPIWGVTMLLPTDACFVEFGAARKVKLEIRFYRNNGDPYNYADLDPRPYKTIWKVYPVSNGIGELEVEENTTSAF